MICSSVGLEAPFGAKIKLDQFLCCVQKQAWYLANPRYIMVLCELNCYNSEDNYGLPDAHDLSGQVLRLYIHYLR